MNCNTGRFPASRILGFDGIRALAVISVVLTHLHVFKILLETGMMSPAMVASIDGNAGVQAFFVLSGFLITSLLVEEFRSKGRISLRNFYIRRALRIFPAYFLMMVLVLIAQIFGDHVTNWRSIFLSTLYLYNFVPIDWYSPLLGHTWSLAVEEHFYLVWPFVFVSLAACPRKLFGVMAVVVVASLGLGILISRMDYVLQHFFLNRWTFVAGVNIVFGCMMALLLFHHGKAPRHRQLFAGRFVLAVGVSLWFSALWIGHAHMLLSIAVRGAGIALVIAWIVLNQRSTLVRLLEWPPLRYVGAISYGVYLYQGFFLSTGPHRSVDQTWPPDPAIGMLLLILVAPASYHLFEKPILALKSRFNAARVTIA